MHPPQNYFICFKFSLKAIHNLTTFISHLKKNLKKILSHFPWQFNFFLFYISQYRHLCSHLTSSRNMSWQFDMFSKKKNCKMFILKNNKMKFQYWPYSIFEHCLTLNNCHYSSGAHISIYWGIGQSHPYNWHLSPQKSDNNETFQST